MASFPELQGNSQLGKTKMWSIRVLERNTGTDNIYGVIETTHGYVDGKKQINEKIITEGKNIGKKNETTPLQQAINEARSAWVKKKESGYSPIGVTDELSEDNDDDKNVDSATKGNKSKGIDEDVPNPMLAHDYNKRGKSIKFPCYVQRKFDGTRCVGMPGKGLFSRNRKSYPHMDHIVKEINKLHPSIILDGELYSDTLTFQEIVGLVKRETLKKGDDEKQLQIKFYIYDIINDMPYEQRYANLQMLFNKYKFKYLKLVDTELCESEEKMKDLHAEYVVEGFEGIMLRNKNGLYKNTRSADLQKYKCFEDSEFEITGYDEGKGLEEGCVIWICKTPDGKTFNCRPRGSREERQSYFINGDKYIGKMLTVIYQEMTDENIPRFPVGKSIRDFE
jgi:ATP-dependent DNA ligase